MRIRQVKPSFWSDAKVATLPAAVRLFYIGLWCVADDGGYFRYDPTEIARDLYGYEPRTKRERNVETYMTALEMAGRVNRLPCGHAIVPKLADHQHLAAEGKQVRTVEKEHSRCDPRKPAAFPPFPASPRGNPSSKGNGNGGEGVGNGKGLYRAVDLSDPGEPSVHGRLAPVEPIRRTA